MNSVNPTHSILKYTRSGGLVYLYVIAAGIFAEVFVRSQMIVKGDPATTAANILSSEFLFRLGVSAELLMLVCDVILALIFFILLKPVNFRLALLAAFLRIAMVGISAANSMNLLDALSWITATETAGIDANAIQTMAYHSLKLHAYGYHVALVFFGFHCLLLGWLIFKSGYLPKAIGGLLVLAGACYLLNSFGSLLTLSALQRLGPIILLPAFIAELSLALWMLGKGINVDRWNEKLTPEYSNNI